MDVPYTGIIKVVGDYGVMGIGWMAFFWAMSELRKARAAHDALVYQLVSTVAKMELIERKTDGSQRPVSGTLDAAE